MTVVLFSWGDRIEGGAVEALTLAADVAAARGAEVRWVVTPALEQEAASAAALHGVQKLDVIAAAPGSTDGNDGGGTGSVSSPQKPTSR